MIGSMLVATGASVAPDAFDAIRAQVTDDAASAVTVSPELGSLEHADRDAALAEAEVGLSGIKGYLDELLQTRVDATCEAIRASTGDQDCGVNPVTPAELAAHRAARLAG